MRSLHEAAEGGDREGVLALLQAGADIEQRDALSDTPLQCALRSGQREVVELLLDWGANFSTNDSEGFTPAERAIYEGYTDILQLLVARGAPFNPKNILNAAATYSGPTDKHQTVEFLLRHGCDVNAQDEQGLTALHDAAAANYVQTIRLLASKGAKLNPVEHIHGWTPLHLAAITNKEESVKTLLELGANPNVQDASGRTPIYYADESGRGNILQLLLDRGAVLTDKLGVLRKRFGRDRSDGTPRLGR